MKKYIILLPILALVLLPLPKYGEHGAFNTWTGLYWCDNEAACLHEIGHALDKRAGWISQSPGFARALQMYILTSAGKDDNVIILLAYAFDPPDGQEPTKKEIYAILFQMAGGREENMPIGLRQFYDWNLAYKMIGDNKNGE